MLCVTVRSPFIKQYSSTFSMYSPPNSVVYTGCVGDDDLADQLRAANDREGLKEVYLVKKGEKTGACAVILTGHHRWGSYL